MGFPGTLKGALLVRAKCITDNMAIAASYSLANYAEKCKTNHSDNTVPMIDETGVFPTEAADVAMAAIKDGVARVPITWQEAYYKAANGIAEPRSLTTCLTQNGYIKDFPQENAQEAFEKALTEVRR